MTIQFHTIQFNYRAGLGRIPRANEFIIILGDNAEKVLYYANQLMLLASVP